MPQTGTSFWKSLPRFFCGLLIAFGLVPTAFGYPGASAPASDFVEYPVRQDDTLSAIAKRFCVADYMAIARDSGLANPNLIYAGKTTLRIKNGCPTNAPSVLVKQNVSPRELTGDGEASSGKHLSKPQAALSLPSVPPPVDTSTSSTSQSLSLSSAQAATSQCDQEIVAPQGIAWNERVRAMQRCFMLKHRMHKTSALHKARKTLVASLPRPTSVSCFDTASQGMSVWAACIRQHYGETLRVVAQEERLDENLILAVMYGESKGDPHAVSPSWCLSLMQLLPSTAEHFGIDMQTVFDPHVNIRGGAKVLRSYLDGAKGNLDRALASYNLGPGAVNNLMKTGFNPSAFVYTVKVKSILRRLKG